MTTTAVKPKGVDMLGEGFARTPRIYVVQGLHEIASEVPVGKVYNELTKVSGNDIEFIPISRKTLWTLKDNKTAKPDAYITDPEDPRLEGRVKDGENKNIWTSHIWTVVTPADVDNVLELRLGGSSLNASWELGNLIKKTGLPIFGMTFILTGKKAEKGSHFVSVINKGKEVKGDVLKKVEALFDKMTDEAVPF